MNEDFSYLEEDLDNLPYLESEMHDPTIESDNPDNYDDVEPPCDVFDLEDDSSSFESIGWGTDEDYGYYGESVG